MPEAKGKENIVPASPKRPGSAGGGVQGENGSLGDASPNYPGSPATTNGTGKNAKRLKGKMVLARVHLLDGTEWDCPIDVSCPYCYYYHYSHHLDYKGMLGYPAMLVYNLRKKRVRELFIFITCQKYGARSVSHIMLNVPCHCVSFSSHSSSSPPPPPSAGHSFSVLPLPLLPILVVPYLTEVVSE